MIHAKQLKSEIVIPTLTDMESAFPGASHPAAISLIGGIAYHESKGGTYLRQRSQCGGIVQHGGLGLHQVEANTHQSIWNNYLGYKLSRIEYAMKLLPPGCVEFRDDGSYFVDNEPLVWDMRYNRNPKAGFVHQYVQDYPREKIGIINHIFRRTVM